MDIFNRAEMARKRERVLRANRRDIIREYLGYIPAFLGMVLVCALWAFICLAI